jgi:sn-glycerol 3-phosphate transport system ATP-binding protein
VALARAMVKKPKVFLMDEPLSNLDAKLRIAMRVELIELHEKLRTTFVYVTHDQVEAMSMADVIVLMDKGRIEQQGTPQEIYHDPNSVFVAQFIGSPAMNILEMRDGLKVGFRPEKAAMARAPARTKLSRHGRIVTHEMLGSETIYKVVMGPYSAMVKSLSDDFTTGDEVIVNVADDHVYYFGPDGRRIRGSDARVLERAQAMAEEINDARV